MLSGQLQQALALLNADLDKKVKIMGKESRRLMLRWRGIGRKGEQKWKDKDGLRLKKVELAHQVPPRLGKQLKELAREKGKQAEDSLEK